MTVNYKQYNEEKESFFTKHRKYGDIMCDTSSMDEYGRYQKTYTCADGAVWYEAMCPTYEQVEVEIKMVKITVEVKMLRTEFWSTESGSKYYYEKF